MTLRRLSTLLIALLLITTTGCGGFFGKKKSTGGPERDPDVVRYRLPLRENAVDSDAAFRCYGECQPEDTPDGYMACLQKCPGFEVTHGYTCADYEVPPLAACFTARKIPAGTEPDPGWVVLAVIAEVAIIVALASVCNSTSEPGQCGYMQYQYPQQ